VFHVILVFCCSYSHINIGVRHVLVLYPLLAIGAAAAAATLWAQWQGRVARAALAAFAPVAILHVASAYPDYLAISMPSVASIPSASWWTPIWTGARTYAASATSWRAAGCRP